MALNIQVAGMEQVEARLRELGRRLPEQAAAALRAEAEIDMTEAKRRTPVLTGALRASGVVTGPLHSGRDVAVVMSFGGPALGYAIYVHENLAALHPRGGRAKFLESVLLESVPHLADRVATRLKKDFVR